MSRAIAILVITAACSGTTTYSGAASAPIIGTLPVVTRPANTPPQGSGARPAAETTAATQDVKR